jgi:glycosyltransferase involved in cell wall biosynthesis
MSEKSISIIIPAFNSASFILEAVSSALRVTNQVGGEVIVVDDGSTDDTAKILSPFFSEISFLQISNSGACIARNHGLSHSNGKFIKFLDADDVLIPDSVVRQVNHAATLDYATEISYGFAFEIDASGKVIGQRRPEPFAVNQDPVAHILRNSPVTSSPLHPRVALEKVGGFDPLIKRGQETNLHLRLVLAGYRFCFIDEPVYFYRQYGNGLSNISSGAYTKFGPGWPLDYCRNQHRLISEIVGKQLPSQILQSLALNYWDAGRGILRDGYSEVALEAFAEARLLSKVPYSGSVLYRQLAKIFGPLRAEQLVGLPKSLLKR